MPAEQVGGRIVRVGMGAAFEMKMHFLVLLFFYFQNQLIENFVVGTIFVINVFYLSKEWNSAAIL